MFGYITIYQDGLSKEALARYRACYCGLCRTLKKRYGQAGRMTLSNDMTFLAILLSALYEPKETVADARCAVHPVKKRPCVGNEFMDYAADMNILLSYYKCLDHMQDDHSPVGAAQARLLKNSFKKVKRLYPKKAEVTLDCLERIGVLEDSHSANVDALCNLTGRMLGEIFVCRDDHWADTLRKVGEGLGRFIYLMDAYEDYPADKLRRRFNPLTELHAMPKNEYEAFCRDSLTLLIADATEAFETLPLEQDIDILRNVLYSGVWMRYARLHAKGGKEKEQANGQ